MHNMEKKIYRIDENGNWDNYLLVIFPDGEIMGDNNHNFEREGFFWSDEPPQEYLDWLENNNLNLS
jgi:hypothetical protein